jgi:antitoxin CptB
MDTEKEVTKARILWQCRRGMLELDILLLSFCNHCYESLTSKQKELFDQLLQCSDQELYDWLLQKSKPKNANLLAIVQMICERPWENSK